MLTGKACKNTEKDKRYKSTLRCIVLLHTAVYFIETVTSTPLEEQSKSLYEHDTLLHRRTEIIRTFRVNTIQHGLTLLVKGKYWHNILPMLAQNLYMTKLQITVSKIHTRQTNILSVCLQGEFQFLQKKKELAFNAVPMYHKKQNKLIIKKISVIILLKMDLTFTSKSCFYSFLSFY